MTVQTNKRSRVLCFGRGDIVVSELKTDGVLDGVAFAKWDKQKAIGSLLTAEEENEINGRAQDIILYFKRPESVQVLIHALEEIKASLKRADNQRRDEVKSS